MKIFVILSKAKDLYKGYYRFLAKLGMTYIRSFFTPWYCYVSRQDLK